MNSVERSPRHRAGVARVFRLLATAVLMLGSADEVMSAPLGDGDRLRAEVLANATGSESSGWSALQVAIPLDPWTRSDDLDDREYLSALVDRPGGLSAAPSRSFPTAASVLSVALKNAEPALVALNKAERDELASLRASLYVGSDTSRPNKDLAELIDLEATYAAAERLVSETPPDEQTNEMMARLSIARSRLEIFKAEHLSLLEARNRLTQLTPPDAGALLRAAQNQLASENRPRNGQDNWTAALAPALSTDGSGANWTEASFRLDLRSPDSPRSVLWRAEAIGNNGIVKERPTAVTSLRVRYRYLRCGVERGYVAPEFLSARWWRLTAASPFRALSTGEAEKPGPLEAWTEEILLLRDLVVEGDFPSDEIRLVRDAARGGQALHLSSIPIVGRYANGSGQLFAAQPIVGGFRLNEILVFAQRTRALGVLPNWDPEFSWPK